jgi:hypothetical protein
MFQVGRSFASHLNAARRSKRRMTDYVAKMRIHPARYSENAADRFGAGRGGWTVGKMNE